MADIGIEVICAECGKALDVDSEEDVSGRGSATIRVKVLPCERCMDGKYNDGYTEGQEASNG